MIQLEFFQEDKIFFISFSNSNSFFFNSLPLLYPPNSPEDFTTLWQGIIKGKGFSFKAFPTALKALGCPILLANSL